ncbi:L-dopachrome tautomerase-related protein [Siphonobacter sp. SORGH_AS_1065]|uniref:L-dopachrome tautomerase-related protein n=1 Tax=Siphonobacter sp. SORGH_AS_1065 TaxID=3041795 RepID=UPI0027863DCD|nr:L-dopachrome tautomerase-related protein [Siphonobacter sp. SORGH_AS_1065]MDQ1089282.1 sugar lactone lactonase YvrE [Siphonobacter sp. SORGH_AS_1065]
MKKQLLWWGAGVLLSSTALAQSTKNKLEEAHQFGKYQPVGLAISKEGRTFVTFPKWSNDYKNALIEIKADGSEVPYPNQEWNTWDTTHVQDRFVSLQAVFIDDTNTLWALDPANPDFGKSIAEGIKLLKINLATNQIERIYRFEDLPRSKTGLNDLNVDTKRNLAYLSDPSRAALVVLDLKTGKSRTLLEKDASTTADPTYHLHIDGIEVKDQSGKPFSSNVNGIALAGEYFYYRPITQTKLFRIPTAALADASLSAEQLKAKVETVGVAGISHGMFADKAGNVYMGDSEKKTLHRYNAKRKQFETLVQDDRLLWPDSYAIGPDGYLYVTAAQYQRLAKFNEGKNKVEYPFRMYKLKL